MLDNAEKRLRQAFDERKDIKKMVKRMNDRYYAGDFVGAVEIKKEIERIWESEKDVILVSKKSVMQMVDELDDEGKIEILSELHAVLYLSDVFVGILTDFKENIKRIERHSDFIRFDHMAKLVKECEAEVSYLLKGCSRGYNVAFAVRSDELKDMVMDFTRRTIKEGTDIYASEAELSMGKEDKGV